MEPWIGWRGRIGLMCVDSSQVCEPEFNAMAPEGVSIHSARMVLPRVTVSGLQELRDTPDLEKCAKLLAGAKVNSIVYCGTSVSFLTGSSDSDIILIKRMESSSQGIPCTTATTAVVRAMRKLGLKRIAVATPYNDEINQRLVSYFTAAGFDILSIKGQAIEDPIAICEQTPETIYPFVKSADHPKAEGIFVSCGDYRVGAVTEALEDDLGKPVVGVIQASFWDAKRLAGIQARTTGFGTLLRNH